MTSGAPSAARTVAVCSRNVCPQEMTPGTVRAFRFGLRGFDQLAENVVRLSAGHRLATGDVGGHARDSGMWSTAPSRFTLAFPWRARPFRGRRRAWPPRAPAWRGLMSIDTPVREALALASVVAGRIKAGDD